MAPPRGVIREELQKLAKELAFADGCLGVFSPVLGKQALHERSGHLSKFSASLQHYSNVMQAASRSGFLPSTSQSCPSAPSRTEQRALSPTRLATVDFAAESTTTDHWERAFEAPARRETT